MIGRSSLEPRLNAIRPDLADARLRTQTDSERYVMPKRARVLQPVADLRRNPHDTAGLDTQLLLGQQVEVFETDGGWAWVQSVEDGYVGYMQARALAPLEMPATHMVTVPRTILLSQGDMKSPSGDHLSMGSLISVTGIENVRGIDYAQLVCGWYLPAMHIAEVQSSMLTAVDPLDVAETLLHTPYLWGGTSGFGIDCSGLVQLSMRLCGRKVLRDSDMQMATIGTVIGEGRDCPTLQRGDLVFWKGHVALACNADFLIHANASSMKVSRESVFAAIERIGRLYGPPTLYRRP